MFLIHIWIYLCTENIQFKNRFQNNSNGDVNILKRKLLTLIVASLLSISLITPWFVFTEGEELIAFFPMALFISRVALPVILLYGIPVSFISES